MTRSAKRHSLAFWIRWFHIYLSMFGFAALFFFALTGLTVNHPDWVLGSQETVTTVEGVLAAERLTVLDSGPTTAPYEVDRLGIVESLRRQHRIRGDVSDFSVQDEQIYVVWKGPGYSADAAIERSTGSYVLNVSQLGYLALLNDLHKGRDAGKTWSWLIDVSAMLMVFISVTGFVLIFYLKRRLLPGLIAGGVGFLVVLFVYWTTVP